VYTPVDIFPPPYHSPGMGNTAVLISPAAQDTNLVLGGSANIQYAEQPFHLPLGKSHQLFVSAIISFKMASYIMSSIRKRGKLVWFGKDSMVMKQSNHRYFNILYKQYTASLMVSMTFQWLPMLFE